MAPEDGLLGSKQGRHTNTSVALLLSRHRLPGKVKKNKVINLRYLLYSSTYSFLILIYSNRSDGSDLLFLHLLQTSKIKQYFLYTAIYRQMTFH